MRATARLGSMRRRAESLMTDAFTAFAPTEGQAGGLTTTVYVAQGATPGKAAGTSATGRDTVTRTTTVGGVEYPVMEGGLQIPLSSPLPVSGDERTAWRYRCDAAGSASDPALLGRWYMVTNAPVKSYATARRLDVAQVPAPDPAKVQEA